MSLKFGRVYPDLSFREGKIELEGYSTRYREGLDLVLRQVSAIIKVLLQKSDKGRSHLRKRDNVHNKYIHP